MAKFICVPFLLLAFLKTMLGLNVKYDTILFIFLDISKEFTFVIYNSDSTLLR